MEDIDTGREEQGEGQNQKQPHAKLSGPQICLGSEQHSNSDSGVSLNKSPLS